MNANKLQSDDVMVLNIRMRKFLKIYKSFRNLNLMKFVWTLMRLKKS